MTKAFAVGDKVRYTGDNPDWAGCEGVIEILKGNGFPHHRVRVTKAPDVMIRLGYGVGKLAHLPENDLTVISPAEVKPEIKIGDKVRFIQNTPGWFGSEGIVTEISNYSGSKMVDYRVTKLPDYMGRVELEIGKTVSESAGGSGIRHHKLEVIAPKFGFKDIKMGDTIRRTWTVEGGSTEVREGTVGYVASWYVSDEGDKFTLAYDSDDTNDEITLELLNRPEPVKEVWEDAKVGDVFLRSSASDPSRKGTVVRVSDGWLVTYGTGQDSVTTGRFREDDTHIFLNMNVEKIS